MISANVVAAMLALGVASCGGAGRPDPVAAIVAVEASGCRLTPTHAVGTAVGDGLVVTVAHAVAGETDIVVGAPDGRRLAAVVAAIDTGLDVAVLRVEGLDLGSLAARPYAGDDEVSLLLPVDGEIERRSVAVLRRVTIRTTDIYRRGEHLRPGLEVEAAVVAGDSGGALVAADGRLLGIVWGASRRAEDRAWAVASEAFAPLVDAAAADRSAPPAECSR